MIAIVRCAPLAMCNAHAHVHTQEMLSNEYRIEEEEEVEEEEEEEEEAGLSVLLKRTTGDAFNMVTETERVPSGINEANPAEEKCRRIAEPDEESIPRKISKNDENAHIQDTGQISETRSMDKGSLGKKKRVENESFSAGTSESAAVGRGNRMVDHTGTGSLIKSLEEETEKGLAALKDTKDNNNASMQFQGNKCKNSTDQYNPSMNKKEENCLEIEREPENRRRITNCQPEIELASFTNHAEGWISFPQPQASPKLLKRQRDDDDRDREKKTTGNESWKEEIDAKNRRIVELEQEIASLTELKTAIEEKASRIEQLEDAVAEFEDFLKQNPDVAELHDLRRQVLTSNNRIQQLESLTEKNCEKRHRHGIDQARVRELERMVTHLEDYVREHNVDVLKRKLQDRQCRIEQLQTYIVYLEKQLLRMEQNRQEKETTRPSASASTNTLTRRGKDKGAREDTDGNGNGNGNGRENAKMKKMEHTISEKNEKIQAYEQRLVESKEEIASLKKKIASLEKELNEYDDIGILKEEIRVRDEKIQQLEDELDSLERAFSERIDLEQIEELVSAVREKEERKQELKRHLMDREARVEQLNETLRETVLAANHAEKRLRREETMRKRAFAKIVKLEQKIASLQCTSALKCVTCQPLLSKLQKYRTKLEPLAKERTARIEDFHRIERDALKVAVSEKDAHLALLELSGIKTTMQLGQVNELKDDKKRLLEKLKEEDNKSIEFSSEVALTISSEMPQFLLKILQSSEEDEEDEEDEEKGQPEEEEDEEWETGEGEENAEEEREREEEQEEEEEEEEEAQKQDNCTERETRNICEEENEPLSRGHTNRASCSRSKKNAKKLKVRSGGEQTEARRPDSR